MESDMYRYTLFCILLLLTYSYLQSQILFFVSQDKKDPPGLRLPGGRNED